MIELIRKVYLKILMYIDPIKAARKKGVKIRGGTDIRNCLFWQRTMAYYY